MDCSNPARSSIFSGRYFWQTGLGAIEQGEPASPLIFTGLSIIYVPTTKRVEGTKWNSAIPTWPLVLEQHGYFLGYSYEGETGKTKARLGGASRDRSLSPQLPCFLLCSHLLIRNPETTAAYSVA